MQQTKRLIFQLLQKHAQKVKEYKNLYTIYSVFGIIMKHILKKKNIS